MARAVSPQVLEQFKEVFDCWNSGDFDEMLDYYAEDGIFDVSAVFVDVAPAQGHTNIVCQPEICRALSGSVAALTAQSSA